MVCICICARLCRYVYVDTYAHMYIHIHTYTHKRIYAYTHINMNTYTHLQESSRPTQRSRECDGWEGKRCSGPACFVSWPPSGCGACRSLLHVLQVSFACVAGLFCMCYRSLLHVLQVSFACVTGLFFICCGSFLRVIHVWFACVHVGWCFM